MTPNIISEPDKMLAVVREFFTQRNIDTFVHEDPSAFVFSLKYYGTELLVHVAINSTVTLVQMGTAMMGEVKPTPEECHRLVNAINYEANFIRVAISADSQLHLRN